MATAAYSKCPSVKRSSCKLLGLSWATRIISSPSARPIEIPDPSTRTGTGPAKLRSGPLSFSNGRSTVSLLNPRPEREHFHQGFSEQSIEMVTPLTAKDRCHVASTHRASATYPLLFTQHHRTESAT